MMSPLLTRAAQQWRTAQSAVIHAQGRIRVRPEEAASPIPSARGSVRVDVLQRRADHAMAECLRINRLA
jgi:hypothetical protein